MTIDVVGQVSEHEERVRHRLRRVKHKIAVMSGKGGVGKSVVTANLAVALAQKGVAVGVLDADIDGPTIPRMLGVAGQRLRLATEGVAAASTVFGIKVVSVALLLSSEESAVTWEGPGQAAFAWRGAIERSTIREFLSDVDWGALDLLLVDMPPGTQQVNNLVELVPELAGVIMVTIPSQVAEATVRRSLDFVAQLGIPVIGLVTNMDGLHCPQCGTAMELFPAWDAPAIAPAFRPHFTVDIPFDPMLARCSDRGDPYLLVFGDSPVAGAFQSIAEATREFLGLSNSQGK